MYGINHMDNEENKETESYKNLIDSGSDLVSEIHVLIEKYQPNNKFPLQLDGMSLSLRSIVRKYNKWVDDILKFLGSSIEAYFFKETDGIPKRFDRNLRILISFIALSETPAFSIKLLNETKKRLERLVEIARRDSNVSPTSFDKGLWIIKKDNHYYFNGNPVSIQSRRGEYVKIFDTVFSLKINGGEMLYIDIISACKQKRLNTTRAKIQRALCGESAIFFTQVKDIERIPTLSRPLFESSLEGDKLIFNNKRE